MFKIKLKWNLRFMLRKNRLRINQKNQRHLMSRLLRKN